MSAATVVRAPSPLLLALEARAPWEYLAGVAAQPLLRHTPRGDGHPVLVLPGMAASDVSTRPLRAFLRARGYHAHGWKLGRNTGNRERYERLALRLLALHARHGRRVSLIGWSLGGIVARELAKQHPQAVRQVITLGSPFAGPARASNAWRLYEWLSGQRTEDGPAHRALREPPPVPVSAVYSRSDGIVAWQSCRETPGPQRENIEVIASHCGLGHHPAVLNAVADRLAQPEGQWAPFVADGLWRWCYPRPTAP
ncbi:MAG: alpha/beta fold hydrolase [Gammaproteobacteria bacterium]